MIFSYRILLYSQLKSETASFTGDGYRITSQSGVIMSPNYPNSYMYPSSDQYSWTIVSTIEVHRFYQITIEAIDVNIENNGTSTVCYIKVNSHRVLHLFITHILDTKVKLVSLCRCILIIVSRFWSGKSLGFGPGVHGILQKIFLKIRYISL